MYWVIRRSARGRFGVPAGDISVPIEAGLRVVAFAWRVLAPCSLQLGASQGVHPLPIRPSKSQFIHGRR